VGRCDDHDQLVVSEMEDLELPVEGGIGQEADLGVSGVDRGQYACRVRHGHTRFGCGRGRGESREPRRQQERSDRMARRETQPLSDGGLLSVEGLGGAG
jgi:hypothetical protein